ncbi:MAG: ABC transporter ATP-binding protein [Candidatus Saccharibacteria bacterium]|nr:ABC transporter ATP-binding protein [Candidatus Saccharibacteria bacterium]
MPANPIIELNEVSKLYGFGDATTVAVDSVSLSIKKGEFVAVMGPSGSGKSTLMNVIGLLDRPTHGNYSLNGRRVSRLRQNRSARIRRDRMGFIFQNFNLLPRINVLENVALPLTYKGMLQSRRLRRAADMLEQVGLADREYFMPKQLSGGQAQRVAIARALVNNPEVIIADEPTGNLDSAASRIVMELLSDLHKMGHTVLLVTHNPELTRYAGRVLFMHDGEIIADERTKVGEVPELAQKFYHLPKQTQEDHLAGISALMTAIPQKKSGKKKSKKKKSKSKKSYKTKSGKKENN